MAVHAANKAHVAKLKGALKRQEALLEKNRKLMTGATSATDRARYRRLYEKYKAETARTAGRIKSFG